MRIWFISFLSVPFLAYFPISYHHLLYFWTALKYQQKSCFHWLRVTLTSESTALVHVSERPTEKWEIKNPRIDLWNNVQLCWWLEDLNWHVVVGYISLQLTFYWRWNQKSRIFRFQEVKSEAVKLIPWEFHIKLLSAHSDLCIWPFFRPGLRPLIRLCTAQ